MWMEKHLLVLLVLRWRLGETCLQRRRPTRKELLRRVRNARFDRCLVHIRTSAVVVSPVLV